MLKVRYVSRDGDYESVAYLDEDSVHEADYTLDYTYGDVLTGTNKHTDEPVRCILTTVGWREI